MTVNCNECDDIVIYDTVAKSRENVGGELVNRRYGCLHDKSQTNGTTKREYCAKDVEDYEEIERGCAT